MIYSESGFYIRLRGVPNSERKLCTSDLDSVCIFDYHRHSYMHKNITDAQICIPFKEPRNRFPAGGPVRQPYLSYRPVKLHMLPESIPGRLKLVQIRASTLGQCVYESSVGNFSPAMGARNQVGIGLSYRPAGLCTLDTQFLESIPRPLA
jgi:hypothetical protein